MAPDPTLIDDLERAATRHATPCGEGSVAWREWGDGPVIVLLHGGFGSWLHWVLNVHALAREHRVLAADLPGLGDSVLPPGPVTPRAIAAPVAAGIHALLGERGRCHLVGFSFGGLVSGQVAAMLGDRVTSLTLVGASGLGLPRQRVELVARTPDMDARALRDAQAYNLRALMIHDPARVDELAMTVQARNDERARLRSRRMSLGSSLREVLPQLRGRLHGVWGEHDVTAYPDFFARRELLASIRPELDFRVVEGAGHWVQYEASDAFNAVIADLVSD